MEQNNPIMTSQPPEARDYFLACYVVSLAQGDTINETLIKHDTIKHYLDAASDLFGVLAIHSTHTFFATILKVVKDYGRHQMALHDHQRHDAMAG